MLCYVTQCLREKNATMKNNGGKLAEKIEMDPTHFQAADHDWKNSGSLLCIRCQTKRIFVLHNA